MQVAKRLNSCADAMMEPFWSCLEELIRARTPLHPGKYGQLKSKVAEIARRIIFGLLAFIFFPAALCLGIASLGPKAVSRFIEPNTYTFLTTDAPRPQEKILSVAFGNICFMPGGMSLPFGGVAPIRMRVDSVAQKILKANASLFIAREGHSVKANYALYEKLKHSYRYFYFNEAPTQIYGLNPGTFIASKYEIRNIHDERFKNEPHRNAVDFELWNQNKKIAHVVTTHLHPSKSASQIDQLEARIEQIPCGDWPLLVTGDMNMDLPESDKTFLNAKFTDGFKGEKPATCSEYSLHHLWKTPGEPSPESTIDYIRMASTDKFQIGTRILPMYNPHNPGEDDSDHHILVAEIAPC